MIGLEIRTSKKGYLWPTGYYKVLVDALSRGGSKHDPKKVYPELSKVIDGLCIEKNGRFYPTAISPLIGLDDGALSVIIVKRVDDGDEAINMGFTRTHIT